MTNEKIKTPDGSHSFWDVFMPGAKLGMHHFDKYDKDYVFVQMPESKAKVFLRCCVFLTIKGENQPKRFAIVHRWGKPIGGPNDKNNWEPIKGQVEEKEKLAAQRLTKTRAHEPFLNEILNYTIQREMEEEGKIHPSTVKNLTLHRNLGYTSSHTDYPEENMHFQYMIFTAEILRKDFEEAQATVYKIYKDPRTMELKKDVREKNALSLWSPQKGMSAIMGGPAGAMVRLYLRNIDLLK
jgi:hypothetical protein